jgi:hypothetical protein
LSETPLLSREGVGIRALVSNWLTNVSDAAEEREDTMRRSGQVLDRLASYAGGLELRTTKIGESVERPATRLFPVIATEGPNVLVRIRSDSALVELVRVKSTVQELYLSVLRAPLSTSLDSLATVLAPHGGSPSAF